MEKKKRKLSKGRIRAIIVAAVSVAFAVALIITNIFVPVKYLTSYMVLHNQGAEEGVMRVRFVDVGYGDCIIIELPDGKNMLIDAGDGRNANQSRILKFLNRCDIDTIDYLVCSSVNSEHCGGLAEILQYKKVLNIFMPYCENSYVTDAYRNFSLAAKTSGANIFISEYGGGIEDEYGYSFTFLSPSVHTNPDGEYAALNTNPSSKAARNNASAVTWLEYAGTSFIFTSDAGSDVLSGISYAYSFLTDGYPAQIENCTIVQLADHGVESSACAEFYSLINPEAAVISVGENGYGCPSLAAISDAVNFVGDKLYRTDEHGTVTVEVTNDGYKFI